MVILLTACIDAGNVVMVQRRDTRTRLDDYKSALKLWLGDRGVPSIVFCDNSGYDLGEIESVVRSHNIYNKNVEVLSFKGQHCPSHLGKGFGELQIISYAMENSHLIGMDSHVLKVTGRLHVRNAAAILKRMLKHVDIDIYCDLRGNLTWADSRVFSASHEFIKGYLAPMRDIISDSLNITFEHVLARAVHQAMAHGRSWSPLPCAPDIRGWSATSNVKYPDSFINYSKRAFFRYLKASVLAR